MSQKDEGDRTETRKSNVDLAIKTYLHETSETKSSNMIAADFIGPDFKYVLIGQLKIFLFAGHDTTSNAIAYAYYNLSRCHPALNVSAPNTTPSSVLTVPALPISRPSLPKRPHLLNQLPYTMAVIKETPCIFASASSTCAGRIGVFHRLRRY